MTGLRDIPISSEAPVSTVPPIPIITSAQIIIPDTPPATTHTSTTLPAASVPTSTPLWKPPTFKIGGGATDMFKSLVFGTEMQVSASTMGSSPTQSMKSTSSTRPPPSTHGSSPPITSGPMATSGCVFVSSPPTALAKRFGSCCLFCILNFLCY